MCAPRPGRQTPRMNLHASWPADVPRPRDYLETADGLFFAVVSSAVDAGHALTSLRYVRRGGGLVKLGTEEAIQYLRDHRPAYLAHSALIDAMIHRVPLADVLRVHRPDERLRDLRAAGRGDRLERRALLRGGGARRQGGTPERIGLGGSLLLGAQHAESDIDLVVYGRAAFEGRAGRSVRRSWPGELQPLDQAQWEAAWSRRGSDLTPGRVREAEAAQAEQGGDRGHASGPDAGGGSRRGSAGAGAVPETGKDRGAGAGDRCDGGVRSSGAVPGAAATW